MHAPSSAEFLDVDTGLVGLLETAVSRTQDDATRSKVIAEVFSVAKTAANLGNCCKTASQRILEAGDDRKLPLEDFLEP